MPTELINKVIYGDQTLIDLTDATITGSAEANKILSGYTAYGADGSKVTGTSTFDVDSSSATATQAEVLSGKTFAKGGSVLTGTMANLGGAGGTITAKAQEVTVAQGYHDGSGKVKIDTTEQAKIVANNIKEGVSILGVTGTYTGSERIKATTGSTTPYTTAQTILPSSLGDYDYFTQFSVDAIYYNEASNSAGGLTVTIGSVAPSV